MAICYWCGKEVKEGEGAREHVVSSTLLQDVEGDISRLILPPENAHKECNNALGSNNEHDFCQIIFYYSRGDKRAEKHVASKERNLERRLNYAKNQFDKMRVNGDVVEIDLSNEEKSNFEEVVKKIIKGLYLKQFGQYLDLENEHNLLIVWNTMNLEREPETKKQVENFLELLKKEAFQGNTVFKFRFGKTESGLSSLWEFLFYERFPVYVFVIHELEKEGFDKLVRRE